jgi:hypothetical protein
MEEYRICYTMEGRGFTKDEPWLSDDADNRTDATELLAEANKWIARYSNDYEVWVECREVTPWKKVDL